MTLLSPMAEGNGAIMVHRQLASRLKDYRVLPYTPRLEYFPFLLPRILAGRSPSLIHTTPDHAIFFARKTVPLVVSFQNYVLDSFMRPYSSLPQRIHYRADLRWFTSRAVEAAAAVTACSRFTADRVRRDLGFEGDIRVIPNGVDTETFAPRTRPDCGGAVKVLFSGNLTLRKGAQWLEGIAAALGPGIELVCAAGLRGGKPGGKRGRIRMLGGVIPEAMPELYNQVDMLLLPTVREGMSLAVLEAMACGLPVVASDCSSMPELIAEGRGGYLCPVGGVDEFAARINSLAAAPALRRKMGEFNRARVVARYDAAIMAKAYEGLFAEVLEGR